MTISDDIKYTGYTLLFSVPSLDAPNSSLAPSLTPFQRSGFLGQAELWCEVSPPLLGAQSLALFSF